MFETCSHQEGEGFNFHSQAYGYHTLLCYDDLTDGLLKAELRDGTLYCSNSADDTMDTFIVTNMDMEPYQIIQFYCGRGRMENLVEESKSGLDFAAKVVHSARYLTFKLCSSCP